MTRGDRPLALLFALGLLSLFPVVTAITQGIRDVHAVSGASIAAIGQFAYLLDVAPSRYSFLQVEGDDPDHARRSQTELLEDGRRLGPPHRPHEYIRTDGGGQFSHWIETLYFSTSDNSDPRTNGRRYTIVTAATASKVTLVIWALVVTGATLAGVMSRRRSRTIAPRPAILIALGCVAGVGLYPTLVWTSIDPSTWSTARGSVLRALWVSSSIASAVLACLVGFGIAALDLRAIERVRERVAWLSARAIRPFERPGWRGMIWRSASLALPGAVFIVLVRYPFSPEVLLASYTTVLPIAATAGVALWCSHARRDWLGTLASLMMTLALFAVPLAAIWQHFAVHYSAVGGLLPFSDASGYYYDARRLIDGHPLGWSARRPAFVGLLATLLAATASNLIVCVAALVALNGVATFLLARQLRFTHGPAAAAAVTIVLFLFYRNDGGLGTVLTENLGFAMGVLAFAALWRALRRQDVRGLWIGLGLLTVALMSRAGAFFVLPALVVTGAWMFRRQCPWPQSAAGAAAAVAAAAALTIGAGRILSDPAGSQTALSNFSYSLYGLVVGGKGWARVTVDHPGATEGAEIYALAWQAFRSRPSGIVEGSLKMWGAYLLPSQPYHAFAFVRDATHQRQLQLACYALTAIALASCIVRRRQPACAFLVAGAAGHVASIPFVPSIDAGLRVYAATIPILAILLALGTAQALEWCARLAGLSRLVSRRPLDAGVKAVSAPNPAVLGVALTLLVFAGPVVVFFASRPPIVERAPCADGSAGVHLKFEPGSYVRIVSSVPDVDDTRVMAPDIREPELRKTAGAVELKRDANRFTAGNTMANGYDLTTGRPIWLIAPTTLLPAPPAILAVCGHDSSDALAKRYGLFYADSVRTMKDGLRP